MLSVRAFSSILFLSGNWRIYLLFRISARQKGVGCFLRDRFSHLPFHREILRLRLRISAAGSRFPKAVEKHEVPAPSPVTSRGRGAAVPHDAVRPELIL